MSDARRRRTGFEIAGRAIGGEHPPYVIAELSANHLGQRERALRILEAAAEAGVDAVKLQTYTPESMTLDCEGGGFAIESGPWAGRTLHDLYAEAQTPWSWHPELFARGAQLGVAVFSSPFDVESVDRLAGLGAPAFKVASFELVDHELLARAAGTGRPLIVSTGMATGQEIEEAVRVARSAGARDLALLHCVSGYPTPPEEANLRRLTDLAGRFDALVGLSDHSLGPAVPVAAVALGASIVEKHVTLSRSDGGPDAAFSLEPPELADLVRDCRMAWESLGSGTSRLAPSERSSLRYRRSLYVVRDVAAGVPLTREHVRSIRPGLGLAPKHLPHVLGRRPLRPLRRGQPLAWGDLEGAAP